MNFPSCTKIADLRRGDRRATLGVRDKLAVGIRLFAGAVLLTVATPRDLYAQDSGIRLGTFLLQPSFSVDLGYDNNATNSRNERAATTYNLRGGVGIESNWNRHSLTGGINTSLGSDSEAGGCDCGFGLNVGTRLDAIGDPDTPASLSFGIAAGTTISPGSSSRNGVVLAERSREYTSSFGASAQGRVNRFYGSASGEYLVYRYEDAIFDASRPNPSTSTFIDSHRDRTRAKVGLNGGYEISPNLRVVGDFGVDAVRHDETVSSGRIDFNVTKGTAGVRFSVPDSNIGGTLEIGAQHVCGKGDNTSDLGRTSFISTGSLDWQVRRTVQIGAVLSRDFQASETEVQNNLGTDRIRLALTANTEVTQDVGIDIEGTVANLDHTVRGTADGKAHVDRSDTQYSLSAVSTYRFGRNYGATGTLTYSGLTSSDKSANYQSLYLGIGISGSY